MRPNPALFYIASNIVLYIIQILYYWEPGAHNLELIITKLSLKISKQFILNKAPKILTQHFKIGNGEPWDSAFKTRNPHDGITVTIILVFEAVCVRTDKANFGPSPIGLIFSVKVNHYIQCTNIAFNWNNSIFSFFTRRFSRWPRNWLICLGRLWNITINVGYCQNTVFYCSMLIILHAKV